MPRPLKWGRDMVDIKLKIPVDLKEKVKSDGINVSEFLTLKLYEHYQKEINENLKKDVDDNSKNL
ncbi:hypothetical protein [Enterococcus casseliflavus]|uniref:hypothetical protein n=1 Tax=Enterococcus casseliflavus TaxID=37734 RepID=UPI0021C77B22|nr:hypothetical protein [Enterococcus casseliflavus]